jgi:hypothetical protein
MKEKDVSRRIPTDLCFVLPPPNALAHANLEIRRACDEQPSANCNSGSIPAEQQRLRHMKAQSQLRHRRICPNGTDHVLKVAIPSLELG